ncbi:VCBS repeat domain-containing M23 family metallopeptidase [Sandaracinus amylolyticus]|nr:VCBS repeat domain-containing M23 family metallopeptidase [Sandaracinus amylolyticus]
MRFALATIAVLALAIPASAQVRHRRPYAESYRLNYGFDNNGGGSGCSDYTCGGACYDGHTGSDFGTPFGTTVLASQSGRVIATHNGCANYGAVGNTCGGRCGNYVQIEHSDGSRSIYCHMRLDSLRVSTGQSVSCGQVLGQTASSGSSSGPHLHYGYRRTASAAQRDPYSGRCASAATIWVSTGAYREAPGTSCGCTPSAESCNGRDDDCDGRADESLSRACSTECGAGTETCSGGAWGACSAPRPSAEVCNTRDDDCNGTPDDADVCEIDLLHAQPSVYAPPRTTDVNADGRADLCARGYGGVRCWRANGSGWDAPTAAIPWSDPSGWTDVTNYTTLRMGDVDGDGRADVCARANAGFLCALATADGFATHTTWRDGISDENGWANPRFYTTIRLADVNGDRRDDLCARDNAGFGCWLSNGTSFDMRVEGPRWSDASGWGAARHYGSIRMGDVNGDRLADVCARAGAGVECWLSDGNGFPTRVAGPEWSDALGWGAMRFWSTMRLADFDGDGRADLCARSSTDLRCARSTGTSFEPATIVAPLADESGWDDLTNYATLRVGDIDADGADDLCVRSNVGIECYAWNRTEFVRVAGPAWSDESGWSPAKHHQTIRLADVNGDGLEDVCGRAIAGWRCHPSRGDGFGDAIVLDELRDDGSWSEPRYWATILSAGHACRAEMESCNGRDDDCDGEIDEDARAEICNEVDDDCDGEIDENDVCLVVAPDAGLDADGGVPRADAGTSSGGGSMVVGGCGCRAGGGRAGAGAWAALVALALVIARRRR